MLILFDNGTPGTLARSLIDHHSVTEARARGWEETGNGELLREAEAVGFEVLVTTDKNLSYQQNPTGRRAENDPTFRYPHLTRYSAGERRAHCAIKRRSGGDGITQRPKRQNGAGWITRPFGAAIRKMARRTP
jgi:hypothetical protein